MTKMQNVDRRLFLSLTGASLLTGCGDTFSMSRSAPKVSQRSALLLPLSGPRAALGRQMAKAVWLVEDFGGAQGRTQILDAGDTPERARAAAQEALSQGAQMIIGPLFRDQTPAVVQAAGGVPVLSLSNDAALVDQGALVFGVTPAQSVAAVGKYAKSTGAKRVALLQSGNGLDARAARAFKADSLNLLPAIPAGTTPGEIAAALRRSGGGRLPDVLYVPTADKASLEKAVASVQTGVTTIGSLQWSGLSGTDLGRLDKACFTGPDPVRFNRLSAAYRTQLDEEMGVIAALAVDAVQLAQTMTGSGRVKQIDGLLGQTRLLPNGTCARDLAILRIDGGDVVPVL